MTEHASDSTSLDNAREVVAVAVSGKAVDIGFHGTTNPNVLSGGPDAPAGSNGYVNARRDYGRVARVPALVTP